MRQVAVPNFLKSRNSPFSFGKDVGVCMTTKISILAHFMFRFCTHSGSTTQWPRRLGNDGAPRVHFMPRVGAPPTQLCSGRENLTPRRSTDLYRYLVLARFWCKSESPGTRKSHVFSEI